MDGPRRILIVKLSSLGDVVHALPVPGRLRRLLPGARLAWVVERKWLPLVARHPDLDAVFSIDSHRLRESPRHWPALRAELAALRGFAPDAALDLQGTVKSAAVTWLSGAPLRFGYARAARREYAAGFAYNRRVLPRSAHVVEQMLELAAAVAPGAFRPGGAPRFPVPVGAEAERAAARWLAAEGVGAFAFFAPGGGWRSKCWPAARYAELADRLWREHGLAVVVNDGPGPDDASTVVWPPHVRRFTGGLEALAALARRARLAVGGDTGPLQLAAALEVPTVALFGPTDPARNGPYAPWCRVLGKAATTSRRGAYPRGADHAPAMLAISVDEVARTCAALLDAPPAARVLP